MCWVPPTADPHRPKCSTMSLATLASCRILATSPGAGTVAVHAEPAGPSPGGAGSWCGDHRLVSRAGPGRPCWSSPPWPVSPMAGAWDRASRSTTPPPSAACPRTGTTSPTGPSIPPAPSRSTSCRARCGSKRCPSGSSGLTPGAWPCPKWWRASSPSSSSSESCDDWLAWRPPSWQLQYWPSTRRQSPSIGATSLTRC